MSIFNESIVSQVKLSDIVASGLEYFGELVPDNGDYETRGLRPRPLRSNSTNCAAIILNAPMCESCEPCYEAINYKELFCEDPNSHNFSMDDVFMDIVDFEIDEFLVPPHVSTNDFFDSVFHKIQQRLFQKIVCPKNVVAMGQRTYIIQAIWKKGVKCVIELKWQRWGDKILASPFHPTIERVVTNFDTIDYHTGPVSPVRFNPDPLCGYIVEPVSLSFEFNLTLKK